MEVVQPHSLPYRGNDLDLLIRSSQSFVHAYDQSGNIVKSDYTCNITQNWAEALGSEPNDTLQQVGIPTPRFTEFVDSQIGAFAKAG